MVRYVDDLEEKCFDDLEKTYSAIFGAKCVGVLEKTFGDFWRKSFGDFGDLENFIRRKLMGKNGDKFWRPILYSS